MDMVDLVRPTHPNIHARGIIRCDAIRVSPPRFSRPNQIIGHDLDVRRNLPPWFVPDAKESAAVPGLCERGIALEQKFIERFWRAASNFICQRRAITERAINGFDAATTLMFMLEIILVFDFPKMIR